MNTKETHAVIALTDMYNLKTIGTVSEKITEFINPNDEKRSYGGFLLQINDNEETTIPFYGYGAMRRKTIEDLQLGDKIMVAFKIESPKYRSQHAILKIVHIERV
jgi:hypothetical protein